MAKQKILKDQYVSLKVFLQCQNIMMILIIQSNNKVLFGTYLVLKNLIVMLLFKTIEGQQLFSFLVVLRYIKCGCM